MFAHRIWTGKMCVLKVTFQVAESAVIACLVVILFNKKDNSSERGAVGLLLSSGATCRPEIDICRRLGTRLTTLACFCTFVSRLQEAQLSPMDCAIRRVS